MIDITASDLEIDDRGLALTNDVDLQDRNAHIGKGDGDIRKHADSVVCSDLQKRLVDTAVRALRFGVLPVRFLPTIAVFRGVQTLLYVGTILFVNGNSKSLRNESNDRVTRQRVTAALLSLGKEELTEIMEEGKTFPVECQFCDEIYEFTPEDIRQMLQEAE